MRRGLLPAALAVIASASIAAAPAGPASGRAAAPVRETVRPLSRDALPGGTQELIAVEVTIPPGAEAVPHRHPAFVYAYVLSGTVVSALGRARPKTYRTGQSWHEQPGELHRITRNPSRTRTARLLALFIARAGEAELVRPARAE